MNTIVLFFIPAMILLSILVLFFIVKTKERLFGGMLGLLLLAYLIAGKGIAYLGFAPIYISEVTLVAGCTTVLIVALLQGRLKIGALRHTSAFILLLFMAWGALRTLPYIDEYKFDALRDGVIWGYAVITLCVALLLSPQLCNRFLNIYSILLPYLLVWLALAPFTDFLEFPTLPGSPVPIIWLKDGDIGVHLAGAAAFILLRLDGRYGKRYKRWQLWLMWIAWGVAWLMAGSLNRGGMLSALLGLSVAFILRPQYSGWLRPAALIPILLCGLLVAELSGLVTVDPDAGRQLSFEQITTNFTSLVGGESRGNQLGTVAWRLSWWRKIAGYTVDGPYFWGGKGFGINLGTDDGFPSPEGLPPNRHPHNITMNILARSGVPGLTLWLLFLLTCGWRLFRATLRRGYTGKTSVWFLAYWLAFLFNAQVDVFLEGPMGGVWFWALTGVAWVYIYGESRLRSQPEAYVPGPYPAIHPAIQGVSSSVTSHA